MRVLSMTYERDAGPGVFAEAIAAFGASLEEWMPPTEPPPEDALGFDAVVVCGSAVHPDQDESHPWLGASEQLLRELLAAGTPLLGLCLGGQLLARAAGAQARRASRPEIGWTAIDVLPAGAEDPVVGPLAPHFEAFSWHSYEFPVPAGAVELARTEVCTQAARVGEAAWALQFHPEVSRSDAFAWIDEYIGKGEPPAPGVDLQALRAETETKMDAFNQLGRDLCTRWLEYASVALPR